MENRFYLLVIRYFFILLLMLLLSGFWMFVEHTQLTIDSVMAYYSPKTVFGLLETVTPHLFGMGIVVFILTHFYAVVQGIYTQWRYRLALLLFVLMVVSNMSPFLIMDGSLILGWVKLFSTVLFMGVSIWIVGDLFIKMR